MIRKVRDMDLNTRARFAVTLFIFNSKIEHTGWRTTI